jgi:two-component system cell cycle sensor histidine kinase/response regulator CckA
MTPRFDLPEGGAHVLIVDDERHNRELLEVLLAAEGYRLTVAESGEQALARMAEDPPDLILLDVMMPGMDGYETTAVIKSNLATRNIPIILVTALDNRDARLHGLNGGAEDFLSKPIDRSELCARVRNLLRLKAHGDHYGRYSEMLEHEVGLRTADVIVRAAAMARTEERTNFALSAADMGVWELDIASGGVTWSASMADVFGIEGDRVPANIAAFWELIHPDDQSVVAQSISTAEKKGANEVEFRVRTQDGSTRWVASRARTITDAQQQPVRLLGVATNINARKSLEAQLRQSQKMEAVGQLAGGVAHDFNNILTAVLGYSEFVIETLGPHDERRADMEEVVHAGKRAATLTRQLLAFSRKQILQPTAVDLNALVTGIRPMLSRIIGEHVDLVAVLAPDLGVVRCDHGQLEQVLVNLVVNARDAMPSGGRLTVETANVVLDQSFMKDTVIHPGRYVMLAVSDSGTGMSAETKLHLFEPFFTTKEQGKGTGLGLATVYGIVKQSGGYVWVYSEPGKGAAFKVYLPLADPGVAVAPVAEKRAAPAGGTETVLVVEDDDAVRALMSTMLERKGYRVLEAATPLAAEALFDQHHGAIDLLVADVIMPGSSGPALFERLSATRPDLRVLFVSGYTDDTVIHQGQLMPEFEFLQKPFTADTLNGRVRDVLARPTPVPVLVAVGA